MCILLHYIFPTAFSYFSDYNFFISFLSSEKHVSPDLVIWNVNVSDKLKDEIFLYGLRKLFYFLS